MTLVNVLFQCLGLRIEEVAFARLAAFVMIHELTSEGNKVGICRPSRTLVLLECEWRKEVEVSTLGRWWPWWQSELLALKFYLQFEQRTRITSR